MHKGEYYLITQRTYNGETKVEGVARLIRKVSSFSSGQGDMEFWRVRFSSGSESLRWVDPRNKREQD